MSNQRPWTSITINSGHRVKIDREDVEKVETHSWRATEGTTGRLRIITSIREGKKVRNITLGAFLMSPPKGKQVYPRRYQDGLDYRKDNLIVCTLAERQRLLPKNRIRGTSQYRGVSYLSREKKWRSSIQVDGKSINLGTYTSEEAAALAYNRAAKEHFGDIAYQNTIGRKKIDRDK